MKRLFSIIFVFFSITLSAQFKTPAWVNQVGAKSFPASKKVYWVNDYGAKTDTTTINTSFIQKAIDACAASGGGTVRFKPGTYVTGALFVKSNVHLFIVLDALLLPPLLFSFFLQAFAKQKYQNPCTSSSSHISFPPIQQMKQKS